MTMYWMIKLETAHYVGVHLTKIIGLWIFVMVESYTTNTSTLTIGLIKYHHS